MIYLSLSNSDLLRSFLILDSWSVANRSRITFAITSPSVPLLPMHNTLVPHRIHFIRGQFVMLDRFAASILGLSTKRLNEIVKRNAARFPRDFRFQLDDFELRALRSHSETSDLHFRNTRQLPYAYTDRGLLMAAALIRTEKAVATATRLIRSFVPQPLAENRSNRKGLFTC